jgi:hypothetical protein
MNPALPSSTRSAAKAMTPVTVRTAWDELPEQVRDAVEAHTGEVRMVETITAGLNAAVTARLHTDTGLVFCKGVRSDRAAAQRREADINPHVVPIAPRLRWHLDTGGWHILGFEHLDARPADLSPHSRDLQAVAHTLDQLAGLTPPLTACKRIEDRWADAAREADVDASLLAGEHLLHTDLNPHNVLITEHRIRVVDWSWPTLGAAWVDPACAALWLIAEGHAPSAAETWAASILSWSDCFTRALDAFTAINAALWRQIAAADPRPWKQRLRTAASVWAEHRRH